MSKSILIFNPYRSILCIYGRIKIKIKRMMEVNIRLPLLAITMLMLPSIVGAEEEKAKFAANSEIYLFNLIYKEGSYSVNNGRNISNNDDYDSQPYFMPNSQSVLFTSARDGKQTDIYEYDIQTKKIAQLTETDHSEFSPKPLGTTGNVSFVSEGFNPYQSVWQLDRKSGKQSWLLNTKEPVGYYQYDEPTGNVLFWSRYGWSVQYLNLKDNQNRFVSGHAKPSSPQKIPNSDAFSFVHRQTNGMTWIKAFNPKDFSIKHIAPIFDANHDYAWAPNGDILRFDGSHLSVWPLDNQTFYWKRLQDLSQFVKGKLGRLSISDDGRHLALVTTLK